MNIKYNRERVKKRKVENRNISSLKLMDKCTEVPVINQQTGRM